MTHLYILLAVAGLLITGALLTVRQAAIAAAVVVAFALALFGIHSAAGWPLRDIPPDHATVIWIADKYVWAFPQDASEPRSYTVGDPALLASLHQQFHGRQDQNGDKDVSPMEWVNEYDKDGGEGVSLLQRREEERGK